MVNGAKKKDSLSDTAEVFHEGLCTHEPAMQQRIRERTTLAHYYADSYVVLHTFWQADNPRNIHLHRFAWQFLSDGSHEAHGHAHTHTQCTHQDQMHLHMAERERETKLS